MRSTWRPKKFVLTTTIVGLTSRLNSVLNAAKNLEPHRQVFAMMINIKLVVKNVTLFVAIAEKI